MKKLPLTILILFLLACGSSSDSSADGCGGLEGKACKDSEYCKFPEGTCGAADETGICELKAEICAQLYAPVCGCDDKTYGNACEASGAGVSILSIGECAAKPKS